MELRKDYKVPFRTEDYIKSSAIALRRRLGVLDIPDFNVGACLERMACEEILNSGKIRIVFYDSVGDQPPAFVTFESGKVLHVDREVWEEGRFNIPWAREVLGHEVGHLKLHNHYVQGYSGAQSKAWRDEESSEWQADRFVDHFLVTDADIIQYSGPNAIANHCAAGLELALRRLGPDFRYSGECCTKCSSFCLFVKHGILTCDNCGFQV